MIRGPQGRLVTISSVGEEARAFVPDALPPEPPIDWKAALREKYDKALIALGRLDAVSSLLPDTSLFLYMYVRKEAVVSSMIEGTRSSLSELLLFEIDEEPGVPLDDVREVSNYVAALHHGLERLKSGFPLSLRLLREIHGVLLSTGRGSGQSPGEFRRSQNWIGGTRPGNAQFVPPPADQVPACMGKLELFLHNDPVATPVLVKAALTHVQFETIHPFLDGNGRLGRLLITLLLCEHGVLREPMLYLSLYIKSHRRGYYDLLNRVRETGDWESWLDFFADAVGSTAEQAAETAQSLANLVGHDREAIMTLRRASPSALRIHESLIRRPIATSSRLVEETGLTAATVNRALANLQHLGIARELTSRKRNRLYSYGAYMDILNQGTDLPVD